MEGSKVIYNYDLNMKKCKSIWKNPIQEASYRYAGSIGSNLLEKFMIINQRVIVFDNFETGYHHNLDEAVEYTVKAL